MRPRHTRWIEQATGRVGEGWLAEAASLHASLDGWDVSVAGAAPIISLESALTSCAITDNPRTDRGREQAPWEASWLSLNRGVAAGEESICEEHPDLLGPMRTLRARVNYDGSAPPPWSLSQLDRREQLTATGRSCSVTTGRRMLAGATTTCTSRSRIGQANARPTSTSIPISIPPAALKLGCSERDPRSTDPDRR
jgi:hypothetical protein